MSELRGTILTDGRETGNKINWTVEPETAEEWQEAVNVAEFYLLLDSARQYGLIEGGPLIDIERCEELLRRGRQKGFQPRPAGELAALLATVSSRSEKEKSCGLSNDYQSRGGCCSFLNSLGAMRVSETGRESQ